MRMLRFFVFVAVLAAPLTASSDGFGWYPNTVDEGFFTRLLHGGLEEGYLPLERHVAAYVEDDLAEENFPFRVIEIRESFQKLARSGISLASAPEAEHDRQWYVIDAVLAPPGFFDRQYSAAGIRPVGEIPVNPAALMHVLGGAHPAATRLRIFTTGEVLGPRHGNGQCLEQEAFGVCIYRYIFLDRSEVEEVHAELQSVWTESDDPTIDTLRQIFSEALARKKPLVFYGQD